MRVIIDHVAGARQGERQELAPPVDGARLRFGRHPGGDVVFDAERDRDASARHAELRHEAGSWVLVDVGSSNGTYVAGQRSMRHVLPVGEPVEVQFGAEGPRCRIFLGEAAAAPEPLPAPPARRSWMAKVGLGRRRK